MDNPAFLETASASASASTTGDVATQTSRTTTSGVSSEGPSGSETDGSTDPTAPTSSTTIAPTTADPTDDSTPSSSGSETGVPLCPSTSPPAFDMHFFVNEMQAVSVCEFVLMNGWGRVVDLDPNAKTVTISLCTKAACLDPQGSCDNNVFTIDFDMPPVDLPLLFPQTKLGQCIYYEVEAWRPAPDGLCYGSSLILRDVTPNTEETFFVGVSGQVPAPVGASPAVDVKMHEVSDCECDGACCLDFPATAGTYDLSFGGAGLKPQTVLAEGQLAEGLMLEDKSVAVRNYASSLDAQCESEPAFSWALNRTPQ